MIIFVKIMIFVFWGVCIIIGFLLIIGVVLDRFKINKDCFFFFLDFGLGFVIFMIVYVLIMICIFLVCLFDFFVFIYYVKKIVFIKYGVGRFYLLRKNDGFFENYIVYEWYG